MVIVRACGTPDDDAMCREPGIDRWSGHPDERRCEEELANHEFIWRSTLYRRLTL
jgi:hypothetical protein